MERMASTATLLPEYSAFQGTTTTGDDVATVWQQIKALVIVALLRVVVFVCMAMSLMLVVEKLYMSRPDPRFGTWQPPYKPKDTL